MFSRRSGRDQSLNPLALFLAESACLRWDLTCSNPTLAGLPYPPELLQVLQRAQSPGLSYRPEPFGLRSARASVAQLCGTDAGNVMLSASTSEAYGFLFKLLCDAGDAVLVPAPSYPLFEHLAELESVQAQPYRLAYDGAWHIDLDSVRRAITPQTRAIVLVSPNNPTGQYVTETEMQALSRFGLPLISDEVFAEFPLGRARAPRAPKPADCLCFTLDGLSKRAGSPQLKLGWTIISGPERERREAIARLELIADTFLSVATPIQHALPELLELCPRITQILAARCIQNLTALGRALSGSPLTLLTPEAGWSALLHLPHVATEEELVLGLLREEQVLVQPGWFYDFETEPFAIVSLLTEPRVFEEGCARLVSYVTRVASG